MGKFQVLLIFLSLFSLSLEQTPPTAPTAPPTTTTTQEPTTTTEEPTTTTEEPTTTTLPPVTPSTTRAPLPSIPTGK